MKRDLNRNVVFEKYPGLEQNGVGLWNSPSGAGVAWFKDSGGNLLSISQHLNSCEN